MKMGESNLLPCILCPQVPCCIKFSYLYHHGGLPIPPGILQGGRKGIVRAQVDLRCREKKETMPNFLVVHSFLLILTITVVIMRTT